MLVMRAGQSSCYVHCFQSIWHLWKIIGRSSTSLSTVKADLDNGVLRGRLASSVSVLIVDNDAEGRDKN